MAIQITRHARGVARNEGFQETVNPGPFVNAFNSTIRAGQELANVGGKMSTFAAQQAAVENDNYTNNKLLEFEQYKAGEVNRMANDPQFREKVSPANYESTLLQSLKKKQAELFRDIPVSRQNTFKLATEKSILSGRATALTQMKKVNDGNFKANALSLRQNVLDAVANPGPDFDMQTALNNYIGHIKNGVRTNVYEEDEGLKLIQSFQNEVALTQLDREESVIINSADTTVDDVKNHIVNIDKSPLSPKKKPQRKADMLKSWAVVRKQREARDTKIAKEVEDAAFAHIALNMPNPELAVQDEGVVDVAFVRHLADLGIIRDDAKIDKYVKLLVEQENSENLPEGFEDVEAMGAIFQNIKSATLKPDILPEDANAVLDAFEKQVTELPFEFPETISLKESKELVKEINAFRTAITDRKTRFEEQNVDDARQRVSQRILGNPLTSKFTNVEASIAGDAEEIVEMLVRSGMDKRLAVEEALETVDMKRGFSRAFDPVEAEKTVLEAYQNSPRDMTEDDILLLKKIIERRKGGESGPSK